MISHSLFNKTGTYQPKTFRSTEYRHIQSSKSLYDFTQPLAEPSRIRLFTGCYRRIFNMSDCCTNSETKSPFSETHRCPANGKTYSQVPISTIKHQIQAPWQWTTKACAYYFCDDPECPAVYFGSDNSVIEKSALRSSVEVKENSDQALICYCYGITRKQAIENPLTKDFVIEETRNRSCACAARHPSGRCCLKDFPEL